MMVIGVGYSSIYRIPFKIIGLSHKIPVYIMNQINEKLHIGLTLNMYKNLWKYYAPTIKRIK